MWRCCPCAAAELSTPLRTELLLYLHRHLFKRLNFLRDKDGVFAAAVLSRLSVEYFAPVSQPVCTLQLWWRHGPNYFQNSLLPNTLRYIHLAA